MASADRLEREAAQRAALARASAPRSAMSAIAPAIPGLIGVGARLAPAALAVGNVLAPPAAAYVGYKGATALGADKVGSFLGNLISPVKPVVQNTPAKSTTAAATVAPPRGQTYTDAKTGFVYTWNPRMGIYEVTRTVAPTATATKPVTTTRTATTAATATAAPAVSTSPIAPTSPAPVTTGTPSGASEGGTSTTPTAPVGAGAPTAQSPKPSTTALSQMADSLSYPMSKDYTAGMTNVTVDKKDELPGMTLGTPNSSLLRQYSSIVPFSGGTGLSSAKRPGFFEVSRKIDPASSLRRLGNR